jgi:hypothetical protein
LSTRSDFGYHQTGITDAIPEDIHILLRLAVMEGTGCVLREVQTEAYQRIGDPNTANQVENLALTELNTANISCRLREDKNMCQRSRYKYTKK